LCDKKVEKGQLFFFFAFLPSQHTTKEKEREGRRDEKDVKISTSFIIYFVFGPCCRSFFFGVSFAGIKSHFILDCLIFLRRFFNLFFAAALLGRKKLQKFYASSLFIEKVVLRLSEGSWGVVK
jgi:hypothetical protein